MGETSAGSESRLDISTFEQMVRDRGWQVRRMSGKRQNMHLLDEKQEVFFCYISGIAGGPVVTVPDGTPLCFVQHGMSICLSGETIQQRLDAAMEQASKRRPKRCIAPSEAPKSKSSEGEHVPRHQPPCLKGNALTQRNA
ncbi:hypothetical protein KSC_017110 [Ktedonobacter sp. SOSP1-52]|uniref:hypothetical protein n=1 Tax=Ktedonobacter sp. SOSP1-52 TaxID=2778366 RepID=UPI001915AB38|nr:hypothetical protein [Ktedonobacter sp. SOSP1-52]GHO62819.1 hypothetical protein KSC_017110 [Ktedonobacter sp. SOSP1-52]